MLSITKRAMVTFGFAVLFFSYSKELIAGDVYFCEGKNLITIKNHNLEKYQTQNFKFSILNGYVQFGKGGYLNDVKMKITWESGASWTAADENDKAAFDDGTLNYAFVGFEQTVIISASCDRF